MAILLLTDKQKHYYFWKAKGQVFIRVPAHPKNWPEDLEKVHNKKIQLTPWVKIQITLYIYFGFSFISDNCLHFMEV